MSLCHLFVFGFVFVFVLSQFCHKLLPRSLSAPTMAGHVLPLFQSHTRHFNAWWLHDSSAMRVPSDQSELSEQMRPGICCELEPVLGAVCSN